MWPPTLDHFLELCSLHIVCVVTFGRQGALMSVGASRPLTAADIYDLMPTYYAKNVAKDFDAAWKDEQQRRPDDPQLIDVLLYGHPVNGWGVTSWFLGQPNICGRVCVVVCVYACAVQANEPRGIGQKRPFASGG
jgi:hypothetical protein